MPRGKKKEILPEQISEQEVYNVLEYAQKLYNMYPGIYTPDLVHQRMMDVNMNPLSQTEAEITAALKDPKNSETNLRGVSEFFEYTNLQYKRMLNFLGNALSFDTWWTCKNVEKPEDYNSKAYKKDENILCDFIDKFDYKNEFKKIVRQLCRQDAYFGSFRDDGNPDRYVFQELPIKYCKLTGKCEYSWLFDFDMTWFFSNAGVDINMYAPIFKSYWKRIMDNKNNGYYPGKDINERTGEWVLWVQTSITDSCFAFKFNQELAGQIPYFSGLFPTLVKEPTIRALQNNKYIIAASRILIGLVPLLENPKSGNIKDMLALNPTTLGHFAQLIKSSLPAAISFGVAPLKDVKEFDMQGSSSSVDYNILGDYNKTTAAMSGLDSRLIYPTDRQNVEETRNSIAIDEMVVTYLYPQFCRFMEYNVNKRTKKYKFNFFFEGTEFPTNRKSRFENAMKLMDKGATLPGKIAAAIGVSPHDLNRMLDEAKATNWHSKLVPIVTAFNSSNKGGAPAKDEGDLTESGSQTRSNGDNLSKGGNV